MGISTNEQLLTDRYNDWVETWRQVLRLAELECEEGENNGQVSCGQAY